MILDWVVIAGNILVLYRAKWSLRAQTLATIWFLASAFLLIMRQVMR